MCKAHEFISPPHINKALRIYPEISRYGARGFIAHNRLFEEKTVVENLRAAMAHVIVTKIIREENENG